MNTLTKVREFHEKFGHPVKDIPDLSNEKLNKLRVDLLQEELTELKDALDIKSRVDVLDALTDLQYVLDGAYLSLGFYDVKNESFDEVHSSNMSKLGVDGNPVLRCDGKILKGPGYFKPNLRKILERIS